MTSINGACPHAICSGLMLTVFAVALAGQGGDRTILVGPGGSLGYTEASSASIQKAIESLRATGGKIVLASAPFRVSRTILIKDIKGLTIEGKSDTRLILDVAPSTTLAASVSKGERTLRLKSTAGLVIGHEMEIREPSRVASKMALRGIVESIGSDGTVHLRDPLSGDAPADTPVMVTDNIFSIMDSAEDVTLSHLDLDLQRDRQPFSPVNHTRHCGILVYGTFDYAGGPSFICKRIRILDCTVRNAHHRGIALYSAIDSEVSRCHVTNTADEAIDIDHFSLRNKVTNNVLTKGDSRAIEINDGSDNIISGNQIDGYVIGIMVWHYEPCKMQDANHRNLITKNVIRNSRQNAILFRPNTDQNEITSNTIEGVERSFAIRIDGNRNKVSGNIVRGAPAGAIKDNGQGNEWKP